MSFLELYNEELFDLLGSSEDALRLKIYEDSAKKVSAHVKSYDFFFIILTFFKLFLTIIGYETILVY